MKWCVTFPEDDIVLVSRRSLRRACGGNSNAGALLSHLLYRVSVRREAQIEAETINEVKVDQGQEPDQDLNSTTIRRTQSQILSGMDNSFTDRTLRDDAIPCLVESGYIVVKELKGDKNYSEYTLNLNRIQQGINHPEKVPSYKTMLYYQALVAKRKKFRTEKVPNDSPPQSEKVPNGKSSERLSASIGKSSERKKFRAGAEIIPSRSGNNSERETAHEAAAGAASMGEILPPKSNRENSKEREREESEQEHGQSVSDSLSLSSNSHSSSAEESPSLQPVDLPIAVKERESGGTAQPDAPDSHGYRKGQNQDGQIPREEVPREEVPRDSTNPLIAMLTEEQATFWLRWCAVSKTEHDKLNQTAYNHIVEWSDEVKTQQDLQDLYDIADKRIRALCAANNQPYVPPRLGNLKNARGDWQAACKQREDQIRGHFVPGSGGQKRNLTYELMEKRKRGESIEPIIYQPAPVVTPKRRHWVTGEVVTTECSPEELTWQCETCGLQPPIALSGQRWVRRTCRCERHARVFTPGTTTQVGTISAEDFTLQRQQFSQRVAPGAT